MSEGPQSASVLMPTYQGIEFLDRLLDALAAQRFDGQWDVLVIDSGSSDGTVERLLERAADFPVPLRVQTIPSREFDHGDTRNLLAARTQGDVLVYLTQDAIPAHEGWLAALVANFDDASIGAVTCQNVHREDAWLVTRLMTREDPGYARSRRRVDPPPREVYDALSADERRMLYSFQNVASALRRDLWERFPFPRTMMGEDVLMARGVLEAGFSLILDDRARVLHSHDYGADKLRWRGEVDARFNAEWLDRICVASPEDVDPLTERLVQDDLAQLADLDPTADAAVVQRDLRPLRRALVEGLYEGGRSRRRYARSSMRTSGRLRLALVIGESVESSPLLAFHARELGACLLDRGHAVETWLLGSRGDGVDRGEAEPVRTTRIPDGATAAARIGEGRLDVVHFLGVRASAAAAIRAALMSSAGVVVTVDDADDVGPVGGALAVAVAAADRVIAPSAAIHRRLAERGDIDDYRLVAMSRGVPLAAGAPFPRVDRPPGASPRVVQARPEAGLPTARGGTTVRDRCELLAEADLVDTRGATSAEAALLADEARLHGVALQHDAEPISTGGERTLEQEALELEFRYRGVASLELDELERAAFVVADGASLGAFATTGDAIPGVVQGGNQRLVLPGESAVLDLSEARGASGPLWLVVRQTQLVEEATVAIGGRVVANGEVLGVLEAAPPPPPSVESGEREVVRALPLWIEPGTDELRLEARTMAGDVDAALHMRIRRVALSRRGPLSPGLPENADEPTSIAAACSALALEPAPTPLDPELPALTVILPSLDGRSDLESALESLARGDYPSDRLSVVVVDNGSTDGTTAWLAEHHPDVTPLRLERNEGFARACNLGAAAATTPLIAFVNNDMRFEADFLRKLVAPVVGGRASASTAKRLSWDGARLDGAGVGSTLMGIAVQPGFGEAVPPEHDLHRRTLFACGGAMAIVRDVFDDVGGFDEDYFAYYEDLDLGWRMGVLGHDIEYVPSAVCYHHHSATSRRMPAEVVRRMVVRNALATCIKNYDDANLDRMLPALFGLATERAFLKSGLRPDDFDPRTAPLAAPGESGAHGTYSIDGIGAADLVALHDVLGNWKHWMQKRASIQGRRARGDSAVLAMFLDPLVCVEGDESYVSLQRALYERARAEEIAAPDRGVQSP